MISDGLGDDCGFPRLHWIIPALQEERENTSVLAGYQIYHNCFRPDEALKGKTPAEKCGIIIKGEKKWKTLIENAGRDFIMDAS